PLLFSLVLRPPPSTLFPYTTLFRSLVGFIWAIGKHVVPLSRQPILRAGRTEPAQQQGRRQRASLDRQRQLHQILPMPLDEIPVEDRKSTRLNSSHQIISYPGFCLIK